MLTDLVKRCLIIVMKSETNKLMLNPILYSFCCQLLLAYLVTVDRTEMNPLAGLKFHLDELIHLYAVEFVEAPFFFISHVPAALRSHNNKYQSDVLYRTAFTSSAAHN